MEGQKQVRTNLITNIITLVISVVIGLAYTPYLVRTLGVVAYGVVPLALIINNYISVFTGSLTGALTRFYSVAIQKGDNNGASMYLSTSIVIIAVIIISLSPVLATIVWKLDSVFNIPPDLISNAQILFGLTIAGFFISVTSSVFNITLYALNRLDLMNYIKIARSVMRLAFVVMFFTIFDTDISFIGYANLFTELVVFGMSLLLFIKIRPEGVGIRMNKFTKGALVSVMGMTVWVFVHQTGDMALYHIDSLLVNKFWGTRETGILGAVSDLGMYIRTIVSVFSTLFGPLILIAYAKGEHARVRQLSINNSLIVGVLTAIICGIIIGYASPILKYWLGDEFSGYSGWLIVKLIMIPFYAAAGIFAFTYRAWNKVKAPALWTLLLGVINFTAIYILLKTFAPDESIIQTALIVGTLMGILQSYGLNSYYYNRLYKRSGGKLTGNFMKISAAVLISLLIPLIHCYICEDVGIVSLITGASLSGILSFVILYFLIFTRQQRDQFLSVFLAKKDK